MKSYIIHLIKICLYSFGFICVSNKTSLAQVTPDNTVNTQVEQNGSVTEITGGETRGDNLFHSFQEFSIPTGNEAFFNNENAIENIFSRVTGDTISQIDGLIRANGSANLFLINPAGIIFNENASLDIGGSFLATTASSVQFDDGEFSAIAAEEKPILTISVPIGLSFEENPGKIVNSSIANDNNGLEVRKGNNITLLGGDISFKGGSITAPGGKIYLGGLNTVGTITINDDSSFSFPQEIVRSNVSMTNFAQVSVVSDGGGSIFVDSQNLDIASGSILRAGIDYELGSKNAQAGDIEINTLESVTINGQNVDGKINKGFFTGIFNTVALGGVGNAGELNIVTSKLSLINNSRIAASTVGKGDGGNILLQADQSITLDNNGGIFNSVEVCGTGNAGELNIVTSKLSLTNSSSIIASTVGKGNGGNILLQADQSTRLDDDSLIANLVEAYAIGNSGELTVITPNLALTDGSQIAVSTLGQGDAGKIFLQADQSIMLDKSTIFNSVESNAIGNGGEINITTPNLDVSNDSEINAGTSGTGNGGSISIKAGSLFMSNGDIYAENNAEESITDNNALEVGGNITLAIASGLTLRNDSDISTEAESDAAGGNVDIDAGFIIALSDGDNDIRANANLGKGGNIAINTQGLFITPNNSINASSELGIDGTIQINTPDIDLEKELEQSELEILTTEQAIASSCLARSNQQASFTVGGNGGLPKSSDSNYSDANFSLTGVGSLPVIPEKAALTQSHQNQALIPAERMVETEDGRIFLVTAPQKVKSLFCSPAKDKKE